MKKIIAPILAFVFAILLIPATPVYAVSPPPANVWYGTLQVEYRYAEGETPFIPQTIQRYGFTYSLVSQAAPVLEADMPLTRTYSYMVWGVLTPAQIAAIKGIPNITMTEVEVALQEQKDFETTLSGLRSNDVDDIPPVMDFMATTGFDASGNPVKAMQEMTRVGVTFKEEFNDGEDEPPTGYSAELVYRGSEWIKQGGYYQIDETFTTSEDSDVPIYVIVADYRSNETPAPIEGAIIIGGGAGGGGAPLPDAAIPDATTPLAPPIDSNGSDSGEPAGISDNPVPRDAGSGTYWSLLSLILVAAGLAFAVVSVIAGVLRKRYAGTNVRLILLRVISLIVGVITLLTWLIVDNFSLGMTMVNSNTLAVGILFAATIVVSIIANTYDKKVNGRADEDEGMMELA